MYVSQDLEKNFTHATQFAIRLRHEYLIPEHLAWAICGPHNVKIVDSILACGADIENVRETLRQYIERNIEPLASNTPSENPIPSNGLSRLLASTQKQAIARNSNTPPNSIDLWIAFLEDPLFDGNKLLQNMGVDAYTVKNFLAHGTVRTNPLSPSHDHPESKILSKFGFCLTDKAKDGDLDPVIGREPEIEAMSLDLLRRRKRNVLLVGEPGVGKTAVVEGLAQKIAGGEVHDKLKKRRVWSIDAPSIVAGTKFRGDFEERMKKIIQICEEQPEVILFIDEVHLLMGMGSSSAGSMDAANILKPALARGRIQMIGATTEQESRQIFEKDRAMRRRFIKRQVQEPDLPTAEKMVSATIALLGKHHEVTFSSAVAEAAVRLAKEHVRDFCLPDSAIDLIDHVGSRHQGSDVMITVEQFTQTASNLLGAPVQLDKKTNALTLKQKLEEQICGQPQAIETLYKNIVRAQAGLNNPEKPLGSFLFVGPTGVGKTEIAKQLSEHLLLPLIRIDLSEYQESHSIARLVGAPPGYTGHDQGGQLTALLKKQPACVLLLDEFDKAHPAVAKLFLQALDYGTLTDGQGEQINLRKSIIIFTTNHGAETIEKRSIGFNTPTTPTFDPKQALQENLPPEFRNRISSMVTFNPLGKKEMGFIVKKFLQQLNQRIEGKIQLQFSDDVCERIAEVAADSKMGARPIDRWIDEHIKTPLAELILDPAQTEKNFTLQWDDSKKDIFFQKIATKKKRSATTAAA